MYNCKNCDTCSNCVIILNQLDLKPMKFQINCSTVKKYYKNKYNKNDSMISLQKYKWSINLYTLNEILISERDALEFIHLINHC
jgi:hypothetical protein